MSWSSPPVVAIAVHDGFFSTGTGAGRSNRALLGAIADHLRPGVTLLVMPVHLHPVSPEYDPTVHHALLRRLTAVPHGIIPLDNGTAGQRRFGDLDAFRHLTHHTADMLRDVTRRHPRGLLIAIDQPFAGISPHLPLAPGWRWMYLPRSSADHHADPPRAAWERHGLIHWCARGATIAAISTHMRTLLTGKGVPGHLILDLPGGLTPDDDVPLGAAPPLPAAAADGFLLAMGRAEPHKGFEDLIDALDLLANRIPPPPHLILAAVSDDPPTAYQRHLTQRIRQTNAPVTLWTRYDPGVPGLLHHPALRAVVVPSRREPLGRVPLEAHAAGAAPVVATTADGLTDIVSDGVTGFTAPPGSPALLADALHRALAAGPDHLALLRANGRQLAAARDYTRCVTAAVASLAPWAVTADTP